MSNKAYLNGMPEVAGNTIDDQSAGNPPPQRSAIPNFLPLVMKQMAWGPINKTLYLKKDDAETIFHGSSFDATSKFKSPSLLTPAFVSAVQGTLAYMRLIDTATAKKSMVRMYLEMAIADITDYERSGDGQYVTDAVGARKPKDGADTIPGYRIRVVARPITGAMGDATVTDSSETNNKDGTPAKLYPIMDMAVPHYGAMGDNMGYRLFSPRESLDRESERLNGCRVFGLQLLQRESPRDPASIVNSVSGQNVVGVTFKPNVFNRFNTPLTVDQAIKKGYNRKSADGVAPVYGPISDVHVYSDKLDEALQMLFVAEDTHAAGGLVAGGHDMYSIDFIGLMNTDSAPYYAFERTTAGTDSVALTNIGFNWMSGGSDGDVTWEMEQSLVRKAVSEKWQDPSDPWENDALNPFNVIVDCGYDEDTKSALAPCLAAREDIMVQWVASIHGASELTWSEEESLAVAIRNRAAAFIESPEYGTKACRGWVVGNTGVGNVTGYTDRIPVGFELLAKLAAWGGADNGIMNANKHPTRPRSTNKIVKLLTDVSNGYKPKDLRARDWNAGMIWVEPYNQDLMYFPQIQSIYPDSTSVLNTITNVIISSVCKRVTKQVHRDITGTDSLTPPEIVKESNDLIVEKTTGRFPGVNVVPDSYFTPEDLEYGDRWHVTLGLEMNGSANVMQSKIAVRRKPFA